MLAATCLLAALAACLPAPASAAARRKPTALPAFSSCPSLLAYAQRGARRTGGVTGVPTRAGVLEPQVLAAPGPSVALDSSTQATAPSAPPSAAAGESKAAPSFSSTNVQEAGVDEPDVVKTDGRRVFAIVDGRLNALDVSGDTPKLVGSLELAGSGGHQMLVRGDRVLVMTTTYGGGGDRVVADNGAPFFNTTTVLLSEIDVSNPGAMTVRRTMELDGALVDGRLHGGTARVVVVSSPDRIAPAAIANTGVRRFVPRTTLRSRVSGRTLRRSVVPCRGVRHPRSFSGLDLLTVLTIDLDKGLFNVDRDAIMAGAQTVYGSPTGLYVASQKYVPTVEDGRALPQSMRTQIHRFDVSKQGVTSYAASGEVTGFVLNQYSLSEHDGALRVASTDEPLWFGGAVVRDGESFVTVLGERGTTLAPLGRVGGLGKGERIYAVRFAGDKGYVVTFRQVDPLYTLDLSDKSDPKVLGELKILGYSAYLHPISDDLLLGVGIDATAEGRRLGTQLSLFDVSDLRRPVRRAQASLGANSSTTAEFDPHAFLYWDPTRLAVIPVTVYQQDGAQGFEGAIGFRVGTSSLAEAGRVAHPAQADRPGYAPEIARSLVIDDKLYTLSYAGLGASRLDTLAPLSFAAFPDRPQRQPGPEPLPATTVIAPAPPRGK
ncbi:MAG TPA: beta-propeller domain-containing protein [Solirubrobacteraceae bacterium]|nr:beta-propeller domain-containing protein [Solirubrobacteraceae bacterium]